MKKLIWLLLLAVTIVQPLKAQDELAPVTRTIAFTNVNIIPSPGEIINNGTVVIQNGLITAVGQNVAVPAGAREIKADTMYLYAGFILGMSHAGVKMPEEKDQPKVKEPANPPDELAGITPERKVIDYLAPQDKSLQDLRQLGFTIAQTAPQKGMLPGGVSLILLKGKEPDEMVLNSNTALYATLEGARRMYPATVIGVMAKYRELYRQAEQGNEFRRRYSTDPTGMQRPSYDRTIEAFYPVLEKQIPVAFKGAEVLDAQRVISLQKELGFNLLLTELKEGWDIIDKVKNNNIDVLFSLDLPEWKEEKKDSAKEETTIAASKEKELLEARKEEFAKKSYGQMALYQDAGVPFAFSSVDAKAKDIHGNIMKMVENGLSEDAALAALTTTPSSMLGINKMTGTVENGKMANLLISIKPYFRKDSKVRYVVIEGEVFEYKLKDTVKADPEVRAALIGEWSYSSESPQGTVTGKITIQEESGILTGTITNSITDQLAPIEEVTLAGNKLSFSFTLEVSDDPVKVEAVLAIEGKAFSGTFSAGNEAFPVEGEKVPEH